MSPLASGHDGIIQLRARVGWCEPEGLPRPAGSPRGAIPVLFRLWECPDRPVAISRSGPEPVRTRYAANRTAEALATSAPSATIIMRDPWMHRLLLVPTTLGLQYCSVHQRAWVEALGGMGSFAQSRPSTGALSRKSPVTPVRCSSSRPSGHSFLPCTPLALQAAGCVADVGVVVPMSSIYRTLALLMSTSGTRPPPPWSVRSVQPV